MPVLLLKLIGSVSDCEQLGLRTIVRTRLAVFLPALTIFAGRLMIVAGLGTMSKVFLAYKTVDRDRANSVRFKLEALGIPLFIDQKMLADENYVVVINRELDEAAAVLVLWTEAAIRLPDRGERPNFVLSEAERAYERNVLVAATLDKLDRLPVPFNLSQAANLADWTASGAAAGYPEWQKVLQALGKKI
jgi:hypothetical protein